MGEGVVGLSRLAQCACKIEKEAKSYIFDTLLAICYDLECVF